MARIYYKVGYKFPGTRLTVVENLPTINRESIVRCICDCLEGNEWIGPASRLKKKNTFSCGCYYKETRWKKSPNLKHGMFGSRIYSIWANMLQRCNNFKCKNYGGRGITVCDEWKTFELFYKWATSNGYTDDLQIDRINNDGNYEPSNCRWVTNKQNMRNYRRNRLVTINGETKTVAEWAEISGLNRDVIKNRLRYNWSPEKLLLPVRGST